MVFCFQTSTAPFWRRIKAVVGEGLNKSSSFQVFLLGALFCEQIYLLYRKRPAMSNGDQDNRSKVLRTLRKDQADAMKSKDPPSNGVEAGTDTICNPLDVNRNTVAVAPHETETADAKNQDATRLDMVLFKNKSLRTFLFSFLSLDMTIMQFLYRKKSLCRALWIQLHLQFLRQMKGR